VISPTKTSKHFSLVLTQTNRPNLTYNLKRALKCPSNSQNRTIMWLKLVSMQKDKRN